MATLTFEDPLGKLAQLNFHLIMNLGLFGPVRRD